MKYSESILHPVRHIRGGAKLDHLKNTADFETVVMPAPATVYIPLSQHIGAPCVPCVGVGDEVSVGTLIATSDAAVSAPIHASVSGTVKELADKYKEAQVAIEVGNIFEADKTIIKYDSLGLGRIIYQLPTRLCEMFLNEVFKKNPIDTLDEDTLDTIDRFFENNLNVSETSRKLYVHRNTLVYRLEKIKKLTGLDLREFDHAIVFKVALMVKMYLDSLSR